MSRGFYDKLYDTILLAGYDEIERHRTIAYMRIEEMILCSNEDNFIGATFNFALSGAGTFMEDKPLCMTLMLSLSVKHRLNPYFTQEQDPRTVNAYRYTLRIPDQLLE